MEEQEGSLLIIFDRGKNPTAFISSMISGIGLHHKTSAKVLQKT